MPRRPGGTIATLVRLDVAGDVLGDVEVDGHIGEMVVVGDLGASGAMISIESERINVLDVTGSAYATISTRFDNFNGQLRSLDIGGNWSGTGKFYDVDSPNGSDNVNIDGDLDADVTVATTIDIPWTVGGDLTGLLRIDGDMVADLTIEGDAGLTGQVIINGADGGDTWQGDVVVGATSPLTLGPTQSQPNDAPFYETLPSTLGGGSIGEAPFNFHAEASTPTQGSTVFLVDDGSGTSTAETYEVTIEHYGPVFQDGSGAPLLIEKGTCAYQADVTANFEFTVSTSSTTSQRTVKIKPSSGNAWETGRYFFTPDGAVNPLACASVNLNPDAAYVWDDAGCDAKDDVYHVKFNVSTQYDLNQNMSVDTPDLTLWTANPVDFNGDSVADAADLIELIDNMD